MSIRHTTARRRRDVAAVCVARPGPSERAATAPPPLPPSLPFPEPPANQGGGRRSARGPRVDSPAAPRPPRRPASVPAGDRPDAGEVGVGDVQIVIERPVDEPLGLHRPQRAPEQPWRDARDQALDAQQRAERERVGGGELVVAGQRLLAALRSREHGAQLAAAGDRRSTAPYGSPRRSAAGSGRRSRRRRTRRPRSRRAARAGSSCPGSGRCRRRDRRRAGRSARARGNGDRTSPRRSASRRPRGSCQPYPAGT